MTLPDRLTMAAGAGVHLAEVECVECEEHVGFFVVGDKRGHVADRWSGPMVLCVDCGDKAASDEQQLLSEEDG